MLLFALVACHRAPHEPELVDRTSAGLFIDTLRSSDGPLGPYVTGAVVYLDLDGLPAGLDEDGWRVESDSELIEVENHYATFTDVDGGESWTDLSVVVRTLSPGVAELRLIDPDGPVAIEAELESREPDGVDTPARTFELVEREELDGGHPQVVVGGEAAFGLRWTWEGEELYGHADFALSGGAASEDHSGVFGEDRDWMILAPTSAGEQTVSITNGQVAVDFAYTAVARAEVVDVDLYSDGFDGAGEGEQLEVVALGLDTDGAFVHGIGPIWTWDGEEVGRGDVFRYEYAADARATVEVSWNDFHLEAEVRGVNPSVDRSSEVGCAAAGAAGWWLLGLLPLAGRRRAR